MCSNQPFFVKIGCFLKAFVLLLVLFCGGIPAPAATQSFTIEQVLNAPFPQNLTRSPREDAIAWVANAAGSRNVWMAKAPDYKPVRITDFSGDDGQEISDLAWSPDESRVFFTRGGGPNSRGELPNPRSEASGIHQEIWAAATSGRPAKLADGHSPAPSPDGKTLAFIMNGQVWSLALDRLDGKASQWIHARGTASDPVWSPDGSSLAFTSTRGDHSFIAVYKVNDTAIRFLDPSVDSDRYPAWSPDGKRLAFIRVPVSTEFEFGPRPSGQPWSIHVADMQSLETRELWRASEGKGSVFRALDSDTQLFWRRDGSLLFPWERDGWLHLYSVAADGKASPPLPQMRGDFEIEHVAKAGDELVFSSNQNDIDRRHLWRLAGSKPPERLTQGNGIEWSPAPLRDGRVAFMHSDARTPGRVALLEKDGSIRDLTSIPAGFPGAALTDPQPVVITAADGMRVHGQIFLPPNTASQNAASQKHPAVVFFHGGSRRQMLLGWHYMEYYHNAYALNQYLASRGFVVLSLNYRSGIGYGLDFREAPHYGATGASEFNDVLGAAAYLRGRTDVDASRIGVWGGSYGGYLTALALARASDTFKAGVDFHGVHDWNLEVTTAAPARDREKRQAIEKLAFDSSPMSSVHTWRSPVLLIQGDDDRTVVFAQTVQLTEALRKQGVQVEQLIFPDEVHDFLLHSNWVAGYKAAAEFLSRYLKP
jgi:dipeptidyl aminopeptidase/acylaminoacyl peptidase